MLQFETKFTVLWKIIVYNRQQKKFNKQMLKSLVSKR